MKLTPSHRSCNQQPFDTLYLDAESLQSCVSRGRAGDVSNSQGENIGRLHSALVEDVSQYFGVGSIPWSPLARGFLARPIGETTKRAGVDR